VSARIGRNNPQYLAQCRIRRQKGKRKKGREKLGEREKFCQRRERGGWGGSLHEVQMGGSVGGEVEILKSLLAFKFTMSIQYRSDCWEFLPGAKASFTSQQVRILKSQLATRFAMENDSKAYIQEYRPASSARRTRCGGGGYVVAGQISRNSTPNL